MKLCCLDPLSNQKPFYRNTALGFEGKDQAFTLLNPTPPLYSMLVAFIIGLLQISAANYFIFDHLPGTERR
jgi:hypothetical protein